VAQPHSEDEGPVAEAEQLAAKLSSSESRNSDLGLRGVLRHVGSAVHRSKLLTSSCSERNQAAVVNLSLISIHGLGKMVMAKNDVHSERFGMQDGLTPPGHRQATTRNVLSVPSAASGTFMPASRPERR
jgi:hypothetical protein